MRHFVTNRLRAHDALASVDACRPGIDAEVEVMLTLLLWCLLFVLCWPVALLALVLWPLAWLLLLPFRLVGITFSALFAFLQALLMLPARVLGWRPAPVAA